MKLLSLAFALSVAACTVQTPPPAGPAPRAQPMGSPVAEQPEMQAPAANDDAGAVVCNGSQDIEIVDRTIEAEDIAVMVNGSCDVVIIRSQISGGSWGIVVNGSGDVKVVDSTVSGGVGAVSLNGSADLEASGTRFNGQVDRNGSADLKDLGGNTWE